MKTVAALLILLSKAAGAADFFHYGTLPENRVILELETSPKVDAIEISGTNSPASLNINAQTVTLKSVRPKQAENGVWVGGKKVKTSGFLGRFYVDRAETTDGFLDVYIQPNKKTAYEYRFESGKLFFELPLKFTIEMTAPARQGFYEWSLAGAGSAEKMIVKDAEVVNENGNIKITKTTAEGAGLISGYYNLSGKSKKLFNIPYNLKVVKNDPKEIVLSLGFDAEQTINVPKAGLILRGLTRPGSEVRLADKNIKVESNGEWSLEVFPEALAWNRDLAVKSNGREQSKTLRFNCTECSERDFLKLWEISISPGVGDFHHFGIDVSTFSVSYKEYRAGYHEVDTHGDTSYGYHSQEFFLGKKLWAEAIPGPTWLEVGVFGRESRYYNNYDYTRPGDSGHNKGLGFYVRTEPIRVFKYIGLGVQFDYTAPDTNYFYVQGSLNYCF